MVSSLPTLPFYVFGIFEPTVLILAFVVTTVLPNYYSTAMAKHTRASPVHPATEKPTESIYLSQLSNLFLLVSVISLYVLNSTDDEKVAAAYLTALWWGDLGHLGVTVWCLGWESFSNVGAWNLVILGNATIRGGKGVVNVFEVLQNAAPATTITRSASVKAAAANNDAIKVWVLLGMDLQIFSPRLM
ncbi:hypothetical protein C7974DRAFT_416408 [Boeremia exigua]|uniref:uncharacterized protein n=1 Tax=Boeremia exigua TaxID=749465 RepID=UPI001E8E7B78|nr:uncharacterized protein C7974DRAFT_416408 [Boeremia exigua]KAH6616254.1 hypothetical protein C7974DRAFT_416408 [Boeremia exigua]